MSLSHDLFSYCFGCFHKGNAVVFLMFSRIFVWAKDFDTWIREFNFGCFHKRKCCRFFFGGGVFLLNEKLWRLDQGIQIVSTHSKHSNYLDNLTELTQYHAGSHALVAGFKGGKCCVFCSFPPFLPCQPSIWSLISKHPKCPDTLFWSLERIRIQLYPSNLDGNLIKSNQLFSCALGCFEGQCFHF